MELLAKKYSRASLSIIISVVVMMLVSGCARYARNVNELYVPSAGLRGGSGDVYIIIKENQMTQSPDIKWVLGKVTDEESRKVDEVYSPRSPAEIIQAALGQELSVAGYRVISTSKRPDTDKRILDLIRAEIELEQISDLVDLKAKCHVVLDVDVIKNGQQVKKLHRETTSSRTDIRDRDLLAKKVLKDSLQSVILSAVPEIASLLEK
jgi:hypothetical protein